MARRHKGNRRGRSGYEEKVMKFLESKDVPYQYEPDTILYTVPESKHRYIPDFKIGDWYCESKGMFTAVDRKKMKLVMEQNPDTKIRMLLMRDNYIRKGSKTKYSDWCEKHKIEWAVSPNGIIPQRWLDS